jgi:hypothetical protein
MPTRMTPILRIATLVGLVALLGACGEPIETGPVLVRGTVESQFGQYVPGATVHLLVLGGAEIRDVDNALFRRETIAGPDGRFEFRLAPTDELRRYAAAHQDAIDFTVTSELPDGKLASGGFAVRPEGDQWVGGFHTITLQPFAGIGN